MTYAFETKEKNALTGGRRAERQLLHPLINAIRTADQIDILVSFIRCSGVNELLPYLEKAAERGAKIRMLTCDYMGITEPAALCLLKLKLGEAVDLRFYLSGAQSFHAKSYIFYHGKKAELFIGSSNISQSALMDGIEWNYRLKREEDEKAFNVFAGEFERLFAAGLPVNRELIQSYSRRCTRPGTMSETDAPQPCVVAEALPDERWEPRGVQLEALYGLECLRKDGCRKALVVAATGVGKTAIAAFDARAFGARRLLFVAHREEILRQAAKTFLNVYGSQLSPDDIGFIGKGEQTSDRRFVFASVQTLGREENYRLYSPDEFDYIVVDEFHHAVCDSYEKLIDYFTPDFLLGLTATPERLDGRDPYVLCDYNVAYEIGLPEAIEREMLVPFHYYGIWDETDYDGLQLSCGRYRTDDLNRLYLANRRRQDLIWKHYDKYRSNAAVGFCVSREHARDMAEYFTKVRNVPAAACYSGGNELSSDVWMDRTEALQKLERGELNVIFTVDMFNEGVDIPALDMVMFLRPTESPTVFLQQLGRGLRIYPGKHYLNVLDFIGNYRRADAVQNLLSRQDGEHALRFEFGKEPDGFYPDGCLVDFELELIDYMKMSREKSMTKQERIDAEFWQVKDELSHTPSRMELFKRMDGEIYALCCKNARMNPFKNYLGYRDHFSLLSEEEKALHESPAGQFVKIIETTAMSRVYKMPVLMAFYNDGDFLMEPSEKDLTKAWISFFSKDGNWQDLLSRKEVPNREALFKKDEAWHLGKIKQMPVNFLLKSGKGFFLEGEEGPIRLNPELQPWIENEVFLREVKDAIDFRAADYYRRGYEKERSRS